ncbi:MAG: hypothetical protein NDI84_03440 [Steroidobacteraceae bacterium]|nr:hypothetical protein [Steroidobacteraceae bacterium]
MKAEANRSRRAFLVLGSFALAEAAVRAEPSAAAAAIAPALGRAALRVRGAERAMLLAAATADKRLVAVGERGLVLVSDDQAVSWRQASVPVSVTLTAVDFADGQHGVAAGHCGAILLSADAGDTWRVVLDGARAGTLALEGARAAPDVLALRNAERLAAEGADKPFLDVLMSGTSHILALGAYGLAFASTDRGRTWASWIERLDNPKALHWYAVRRRGDTIVAAGEQGLLRRSVDGGRSFTRIEVPYKGSFFTLELPGEQDIVLAGLRGNAWRSRDAGHSWTKISTPSSASITASLLAPDGTLLFGNQQGMVMRLAGDRLEPIQASALPPVNGLLLASGRRVTALTAMGAKSLVLPAIRKG